MSTERITQLVCDDCGAAGPAALPDQSAVKLARAEGWGTLKIDLCPNCLKIHTSKGPDPRIPKDAP